MHAYPSTQSVLPDWTGCAMMAATLHMAFTLYYTMHSMVHYGIVHSTTVIYSTVGYCIAHSSTVSYCIAHSSTVSYCIAHSSTAGYGTVGSSTNCMLWYLCKSLSEVDLTRFLDHTSQRNLISLLSTLAALSYCLHS